MGLFDFRKKKKNKNSSAKVTVFAISDDELSKSWKNVQKAPLITWTPMDVAFWVKYELGYKFYIEKFVQNEIGGKVLATISENALKDLGVTSVGHRNDILQKVRERLLADRDNEWDPNNPSETASSKSTSSINSLSSPSTIAYSPSSIIKFKLVFEGVIHIVKLPADVSLEVLETKANEAYGHPVKMMYTDCDQDLISITKTSDLRDAIEESNGKAVKIHVYDILNTASETSSMHSGSSRGTSSSFSETASMHSTLSGYSTLSTVQTNSFLKMQAKVLNSLNDPAIVISNTGSILVFNDKALSFFGYTRGQVLGNNVKIIMPPEIAANHDQYLQRYVTTREPHVIGSGRRVDARKKDGTLISVVLSVSESSEAGMQTFTGTFSGYDSDEAGAKSNGELVADFGILEKFPQPAIVINEIGKIQFFNLAACKMSGYEVSEVLGHNVKMLMPEPYKSKHNKFLRKYNANPANGKAMGSSRSVPFRRKDGNLVAVQLNLNETKRSGKKAIYTAILNMEDSDSDDSDAEEEVTLEQQVTLANFLNLPATVIDSKGMVHAWNKKAVKTFGYKDTEILGKNITKIIADEEHIEHHDEYLQNYLTTGIKKVIGSDRVVEAKSKSGEIIKTMLNVKEIKCSDGNRVFLGLFMVQK